MTAKQPTADKPAATVEKTVTVNAYAPDFGSDREFADALDDERDYYETRSRTRHTYVASLGDYNFEIASETYDGLSAEIDAGVDTGELSIERRESTTQDHRYSPSTAPNRLAERFCESLEFEGLQRADYLGNVWKDDEGEWIIHVRSINLQPRRVLAHHDRRTSENRYEGDEEVMSAQWTINLGPASEAEVDEWNERITGPFAQFIAENPAVEKVRIADCKERVEKEGDCFDF